MRKVTPLTQSDCFTPFFRAKKKFDFLLPHHKEYELNLIVNAKGAKRIGGDHTGAIDGLELVLVGPNLYHAWFTLTEVANMPAGSFSRFIKKRSGSTFINSLKEIRLGHATRMLIETTQNVAKVTHKCGFNNISNFNRTFKKKKGYTPKEFRGNFSGTRIFLWSG